MEDGDVIGFTMPGPDGPMDFGLICACGHFWVKPDDNFKEIICAKCRSSNKFSVTRAIREDEFPEIPTNKSLGWDV